MRLLVFLMLSAWPVVASPGRPGATATLVNRTGRIWQIKADACASMAATVWLTVTGAGRSPAPVRVEAVVKQDVALELPPGAHVQFTHMEAPGTEVGRFFELLAMDAMDAESAAQGGASEGYLFFQTYATWFGLGQDRPGGPQGGARVQLTTQPGAGSGAGSRARLSSASRDNWNGAGPAWA